MNLAHHWPTLTAMGLIAIQPTPPPQKRTRISFAGPTKQRVNYRTSAEVDALVGKFLALYPKHKAPRGALAAFCRQHDISQGTITNRLKGYKRAHMRLDAS